MRIRKLAVELATDDRSVIALLNQLGHARYTSAEQQLPAEVEAQVRRNARQLPRVAGLPIATHRHTRLPADPESAAFSLAMGGVRPLGPDVPRPHEAPPPPRFVAPEPEPLTASELAAFDKEMARVQPLGAAKPAKPAPVKLHAARPAGADLSSPAGGRQAVPPSVVSDVDTDAVLAAMGVSRLDRPAAAPGARAGGAAAAGAARPASASVAAPAAPVATAAQAPVDDIDAGALLAAMGVDPLRRGRADAAAAKAAGGARAGGAAAAPGARAGGAAAAGATRPASAAAPAARPAAPVAPAPIARQSASVAGLPPRQHAPSSFNPPARERGWVDPRVELAEARAFEAEQRLADAEARLAASEARVRVVEEHLALADGETAAAHARAVAEEERAEALAAQLVTGPNSLRACLERRGLRGEEEQIAAIRALIDGRRYHELARLELAHPPAALALLWERVALLAEDEPVPAGVVAVRVPADRSEGQRSPAVRAALSRLSTACLVSGTKRIGVAGGPPALHRLLRDGLDSRIELQQWPGDFAARGLPSTLPNVLVLWATDVPAARYPGAIECAEPDLVSLATRVAEALG
jgi:hypothetical protein